MKLKVWLIENIFKYIYFFIWQNPWTWEWNLEFVSLLKSYFFICVYEFTSEQKKEY